MKKLALTSNILLLIQLLAIGIIFYASANGGTSGIDRLGQFFLGVIVVVVAAIVQIIVGSVLLGQRAHTPLSLISYILNIGVFSLLALFIFARSLA